MAGRHHWLNGRESEWTPGVGDGQGGLVCCDSWGRRVGRDWATELNWIQILLKEKTTKMFGYFKKKKRKTFVEVKFEYQKLSEHSVVFQFSSVTQTCPTLRPHESQHTRPPCPLPTPGVYPNSCPSSQWCHPAILCHPLLLLLSVFPSIRVFSNESAVRIRWPKYWSFSFRPS